MLALVKQFFDLNDFSQTASEAQTMALLDPNASLSASWGDISSNLSILVSFLGQLMRFFTTALGWLGGWGALLLVVAFFALSFLNFLSPFKRSNYLLVLVLTNLYGYTSAIPVGALVRFSVVMIAPALLSVFLYFLAWLISYVTKSYKKSHTGASSSMPTRKRQIPLRYIRQQRRACVNS